MPRLLNATSTFDDLEDEVLFTIAAIQADPDAADLLPMTGTWLGLISTARAGNLTMRQQAATADAQRIIANGRLDSACVAFGDALFAAVGKDRASARWKTFFAEPVSSFVKQALDRQLKTVKGWLGLPSDAALEPHRPALQKWADAAASAQVKTAEVAGLRGLAWQQREALTDALTRDRDGLASALGQRARERGLQRDWPELFFLVRRDSSRNQAVEQPPQPA